MASPLVDLFGEKLLSGSGEVATKDALAGKGAIAIYFSAHWCPPCKGFTPQLAGWYKDNLQAKGLEVVFVSSDRDDASFTEYFGEMPWLALPYSEREKKEALSKKFKVQGIPSVVILDGEGKTITKDGRSALSSDPTGEDFPWKPKSLQEILAGAKLIGKDGPVSADKLMEKPFALYFSAHWCPPCRGFTPRLAQWYNEGLKEKIEIVFVSSDRDEGAFKAYYDEQPWLALDYECRKEKELLSNKYGVQGIPSFVVLDKDGSVINTEGRSCVTKDPKGAEFPWYPKPVDDMADGPGSLNEAPVVLAFCETASEATQKAAEAAMTPLAKKFKDEAKAKGDDDPEVCFMIAKSAAGIPKQLRDMMGLEGLPPGKHEHELKEHDGNMGMWGCDGCGRSGRPDVKRFRCVAGCDFDYCEECNGKAGSACSVPPKLMIINIPQDGAFHEGPEGEVTSETVEKFVADFQAGKLERKQLQK